MAKKVSYIFLLLLFTTKLWGQDEMHINDETELFIVFDSDGSKWLDTTSRSYKLAKKNILQYCNSRLDFKIDSTAILYSCRAYKKHNPYTSKEEKKIIRKEHLKYEFFVSFKIKQSITYRLHFFLNKAMEVRYEPKWLFKSNKKEVWGILEWKSIEEKIINYKNGFITPIGSKEIEYSDLYKKFVYIINQGRNKDTVDFNKSEFGYNYKTNLLIINALNGEVIEEKEVIHRVTSSPKF